ERAGQLHYRPLPVGRWRSGARDLGRRRNAGGRGGPRPYGIVVLGARRNKGRPMSPHQTSTRIGAAGLLVLAFFALNMEAKAQSKTPRFSFKVVKAFPHDPTAFTQGLVFADGIFYESTGLNGHSTLRKVTPETGEVIQQ